MSESYHSIYVASKFEERARAKALMEDLRLVGFQIAHDWTGEEETGEPGRHEWGLARQSHATADFHGVLEADRLVVIDNPLGRGLYVELGIALARNSYASMLIDVIGANVQDPGLCIFYHHYAVKHHLDEFNFMREMRRFRLTGEDSR